MRGPGSSDRYLEHRDNLPASLEEQLERVVGALEGGLGRNLHSCVLYGSAVRGDFVARRSDLDLLIVLGESTPLAHDTIADALLRHPRIDPFVLDRRELVRSFAAFPVKFRSIQRNHRVLAGVDPFRDLRTADSALAYVCEQGLRNLQLRSVRAFVLWRRNRRRYARFLVHVGPDVFVELSELLRLMGRELPKDHADRIPCLVELLGPQATVLADLRRLRRYALRTPRLDVTAVHARLFATLGAALRRLEEAWPTVAVRSV